MRYRITLLALLLLCGCDVPLQTSRIETQDEVCVGTGYLMHTDVTCRAKR